MYDIDKKLPGLKKLKAWHWGAFFGGCYFLLVFLSDFFGSSPETFGLETAYLNFPSAVIAWSLASILNIKGGEGLLFLAIFLLDCLIGAFLGILVSFLFNRKK